MSNKTTEEMIAVMQAHSDGKIIECKTGIDWEIITVPSWNWGRCDYRVAQIDDYIDWSHVAPEFVYMARNSDGKCHLFPEKPEAIDGAWKYSGWMYTRAETFASYKYGNRNWEFSLVERPAPIPDDMPTHRDLIS